MSRMSMLPPTRRGGTMLCWPGSAGARPMVPQNGFSGTRPPGPYRAGVMAWASYFQICRPGSLNWSVSRPKPGMFAVQPQPEGANDSSVTLIASPGSAPSTYTGPATGLTRAKSSLGTSATVDVCVICPAEASIGWNSMVSPGFACTTGLLALFQPKWLWSWWMVWLCLVGAFMGIPSTGAGATAWSPLPRSALLLIVLREDVVVVHGDVDGIGEQCRIAAQPLRMEGE